MKLTLRKASALQNAIQEQIKTVDVGVSVTLNEFQDAEFELTKARNALVANDQRRAKLTKAMYNIRAQVGRANAEAGVADLLAQAAYVDKRLGHLKGLTEATEAESLDVVKGKLRKLSESEKNSRIYGYNDTVSTGVLTTEQVEGFKAEMRSLKKEKQSINDKVLELNVRTEIELGADTLEILQAEQLV